MIPARKPAHTGAGAPRQEAQRTTEAASLVAESDPAAGAGRPGRKVRPA